MNESIIEYRPQYAKLGIKANSVLILSYLIQKDISSEKDEEGYFHQSIKEMCIDTGLSTLEAIGARKRLVAINAVTESRMGMPARVYFKVNLKVLKKLLLSKNN